MSTIIQIVNRLEELSSQNLTPEEKRELFGSPLDLIKLFYRRGSLRSETFCDQAARAGNIAALEWGWKKGFPLDIDVWITAHSYALEWMVQHLEVQRIHLEMAIVKDYPKLVEMMLEKLCMKWTYDLTLFALKSGSFEVLKSIHAQGHLKDLPETLQPQCPSLPQQCTARIRVAPFKPDLYREVNHNLAIKVGKASNEGICVGVVDLETELVNPLTPDLIKICIELGLAYVDPSNQVTYKCRLPLS